ncbi:MAG TPA: hypothetical protein DCS07_05765 [Bdellovibrionales bacterium]|nr:MAG: hypothetical protein A2Z97_01230 [Bdellovibrionales bacterium GWB1_52_6]OFZ06467.1 MAG: hypothetical protein A2X97_16730 [Bdellovibrionales bacterium GWA1_52_35]OFZ37266.1 MAG: hypothetical protein A2070_08795 [Bdellovibrionales bacterium GWC1_52_8]HAR42126.1 hypothetical protein [Bdellovibrionales bacterium]HCM39468.1 hypothetical protein [Bdellovibrionales bacterium]
MTRYVRHLLGDWRDDRAQATVEYILIMMIVMSFVLLLFRSFLKPAFQRMSEAVSKRLDGFFGDFHYFPVGRRS